jgi:uncharacterized membrane protein
MMADAPLVKVFILLALALILAALASGFMGLFKEGQDDRRTVRALTWRVGLSLGLFLVIVVLGSLGVIEPR